MDTTHEDAWPTIAVADDDDEPRDGGEPESRRFANATEILAIPDIETRDVWVPEWKTYVRVRALSSIERDRILDSNRVGKGRKERVTIQGIEAKFVIEASVAPDGGPLFRRADFHKLSTKNAGAVSRLYAAIAEMSGLGADAGEEARGNSWTAPNGASPSG
jgi:hypothetical protein